MQLDFIKNLTGVFKTKSKAQMTKEEAEFLPAVLEITETPPSPIGRLMLWTIVLLVIGGLLWSIIGKIDEVAVALGKLIPVGNVKVIQAEDKGVVKAIYVKDGQRVRQGEPLLDLDATVSAADLARIRKEIGYNNLEIDRIMAEKENMPFVPRLQAGIDQKDIDYQVKLYQSRIEAYQARVASGRAGINQSTVALEVAGANQSKLTYLYEIAKDKEGRIQQLVDQNAVAYFVLLDHRAKRLELEQSLAAQTADLRRLGFALAQSQEALRSYQAEWDRDLTTNLVQTRKQLLSWQEELKKAEEKDRLSRIVAPIDGRVHQLAVHTLGGIVTAAQPLLIVVPDDVTLEVEAYVANKDIGFIQVGQRAEVKVETFSFQKYGVIDAVLTELSPDAVEDQHKGLVYRAKFRLDKDYVFVNNIPIYLTPGMSVTAEIKTNQKRIIEFFLDPFKKYQSEGLRER